MQIISLPSSVTMVPQYTTKPLGGTGKGDKSEANRLDKWFSVFFFFFFLHQNLPIH